MRKWQSRAEKIVLPLLVAVVVAIVWTWIVRITGTKVFPTPGAVLAGLVTLAKSGLLWRYAKDSLFRVGVGFAIATATGIPLGLLIGGRESVAVVLRPLLELMRPISPIAWIPVAILLFGVGDVATIFLVFLGAFFPIVVSTATAVENVPPIFVAAGRNFGLSPAALFVRVVLPASLPRILTGLRIALGIGWLVLVAGEMVAVDSGLGYLVLDARNAGQRYDLVVGGMLLIGVIGLVLDLLLRRLSAIKRVGWGIRTNER